MGLVYHLPLGLKSLRLSVCLQGILVLISMKLSKKNLDAINATYGRRRSVLLNILLFLAVVMLLNTSIVRSYQVDGASMVPTLQNNDRLIVNKIPRSWAKLTRNSYIPGRGDIIVFSQANVLGSKAEKQLIKRVVGLPGERVTIKNGFVTIYNNANPGGFDPDVSQGYKTALSSFSDPVDITLKHEQLFVLGDNRSNSEDSRYFGPIKANQIVGRLALRLLPLNEAQRF